MLSIALDLAAPIWVQRVSTCIKETDDMQSQTPQPEAAAQRREILALVKRVERRVRFQRALERGTAGGVVYLMLMAVVVTLYTTLWMSWDTLVILALALAALPIGMALWGWFSNI